MQRTITMPDGTKLVLNATVTNNPLTPTEIQLIQTMKKEIGLADFTLDPAKEQRTWHIALDRETIKSVQTLLVAKGIKQIPFVLADGTIRFKNILIIPDSDGGREYLPKSLLTLVGVAIVYRLFVDEQAAETRHEELVRDVVTSLRTNGTWDSPWLDGQAQLWIGELQHIKVAAVI